MPLQATSGAASYDAFGGGVAAVPNYIEDVFSTYLYTGTGALQTINNGIDLSTKGGMVWSKSRSAVGDNHVYDTARGIPKVLFTNGTNPSTTYTSGYDLTSFNTNGFSLGPDDYGANSSGVTYSSWTFRKQPKFFDVVTYTGTGSNTTIPHNLGSAPGCMIVKCTSNAVGWNVYHRSLTSAAYQLELNTTSAEFSDPTIWNSTAPTSTEFSVGTNLGINGSGRTYVAYLFAHNAGGFGLTGTDNVISCGSASTDSGGNWTATLGYEPQWILWKSVGSGQWEMHDTMRGANLSETRRLFANLSNAEGDAGGPYVYPTATGFVGVNGPGPANSSIIYIAIRRGPMKVPTDGTSVFTPYQVPASPTTGAITGFVTDAGFIGQRAGADKFAWGARLMGNPTLNSTNTNAESANTNQIWGRMNGWWNTAINNYMTWGFARAPGFMDVVCYTGTGSARTVAHNLAAVPELMIVKERNGANGWQVYSASLTNTDYLILNTSAAVPSPSTTRWNSTTPTSTVFSVGTHGATNGSGQNFVAYLFASCPGVSKVFSYTGNGSSQTINCGFTGGARFVMIKRTDSTGDWYVWDTARGIVANNDPHLSLNSTAAEVTTNDTIDTDSTGFVVNQVSATNVNVSSATYIGLAIA